MELKRTMHHGRMLIALSAIQQPREIGVQAFIVTHHACLEVVEPCHNCQQNDPCKDRDLISDRRECRVDWSLEPGGFFVGHNTLIDVGIGLTYTSF